MATGNPLCAHLHLRTLQSIAGGSDLSDRLLLERFAATRDEDAFVTLIKRHGALVWGVCWRSLRHTQDAEDCFQATFVVLARRAGSIRWRESAANWLYGVASRVAAEAKAKRMRLRAREQRESVRHEEVVVTEDATRELCASIDQELKNLPACHREPLVLRYLEGRSTEQAARLLGWSPRTFERRLAQGLERLRGRLSRRGLSHSGVLLAIALSDQNTRAAVSANLEAATLRSALSPGQHVSATVLALSQTASRGVVMTKLNLASLAVLLAGMTVGSSLLFGNDGASAGDPAGIVVASQQPNASEGKPADAPEAALARRAWAILEIVEKNHLKPPSREGVVLKGIQSFLKEAGAASPEDLAQRVRGVTSEEKLHSLLHDLWPRDAAASKAPKLEAALFDGMFDGIPGRPHLSTALAIKIQEQLRGNRYVGTGVQIGVDEKEKLVQIQIPFRRGPARKAGAKPGDLIVEVDGKSTLGLVNAEEMAKMLRGPEGTTVVIVVRQPGETETRTLKVVRGAIPLDSTFGFKRVGEDGWDYVADAKARIAYIWVKSVNAGTLHELKQLEARLERDGMRALVLDFRFSRGDGHLHDAGLLAGGLLDGSHLWTVTNVRNPPKEWRADRDPLFRDWPIAVLVNEIEDNAQGAVLAALQDNRRAVLVGEATKNDGAVRQLFPLPDQDGNITVLTGQLERADKSRGWPVRPDRVAGLTKVQRSEVEKWLTMKQLPVLPSGTDDRAPADPQFDEAVATLREALKKGPGVKEGK